MGREAETAETGNVPDTIGETLASQRETDLIETEAGNAGKLYYRMTYTREADADEIMGVLLTEEAQKAAYREAEIETVT